MYIHEMNLEQRKTAYKAFLKYGCTDTFHGFLSMFWFSKFDEKGNPVEIGAWGSAASDWESFKKLKEEK